VSLTDRLAAARGRTTDTDEGGPAPAGTSTTPAVQGSVANVDAKKRVSPKADPFQDLKRTVHQRLVEALGPKLYDAHMTQSELEQQVRLALQTAIADTDTPTGSVAVAVMTCVLPRRGDARRGL